MANVTYKYDKASCGYCTDEEPPNCTKECIVWVDLMLGLAHIIIGLVGVLVNSLALYLFFKIGQKKTYYTVIAFETFTDLVVCGTALYSGAFLLSGRDSVFDRTLVCELAGMLWNWNMVITPLLLSLAGAIRFQAIYWPYSAFLISNRCLVTALCIFCYLYGIVFASFPYFYENLGYAFHNVWSVCDFMYDAGLRPDVAKLYLIIMGPIPMILSLLCIIFTNIVIAIYLTKRYKESWAAVRRDSESTATFKEPTVINGTFNNFITSMDQKVHSKQVVVSLLLMTIWYMLCYSVIIFNNFKNLSSAWIGEEVFGDSSLGLDGVSLTYFYAMYNFLAYLNSFVNPFILLMSGNSFRKELARVTIKISNTCALFSSNTSPGPAAVANNYRKRSSFHGPLPNHGCELLTVEEAEIEDCSVKAV